MPRPVQSVNKQHTRCEVAIADTFVSFYEQMCQCVVKCDIPQHQPDLYSSQMIVASRCNIVYTFNTPANN